jgi:hypothetical protein
MENAEVKACPSSVADLQSKYDELVEYLEYENACTNDRQTEKRIRLKLIEQGVWPSPQNN